jgi:hypothetical protein
MKTLIGVAAVILVLSGIYFESVGSNAPVTTASIAPSNFAKSVSITRADWRRDGIGGAVAVAEFGVRNNNDFAIRIESVTCAFQLPDGKSEERTAKTYEIVHPRSQRTVRNLGFGFIDAELKSSCHIKSALKA